MELCYGKLLLEYHQLNRSHIKFLFAYNKFGIHFLKGGVDRRNSGEGHYLFACAKREGQHNLTQQRGGATKFFLILYKFIQTDL